MRFVIKQSNHIIRDAGIPSVFLRNPLSSHANAAEPQYAIVSVDKNRQHASSLVRRTIAPERRDAQTRQENTITILINPNDSNTSDFSFLCRVYPNKNEYYQMNKYPGGRNGAKRNCRMARLGTYIIRNKCPTYNTKPIFAN